MFKIYIFFKKKSRLTQMQKIRKSTAKQRDYFHNFVSSFPQGQTFNIIFLDSFLYSLQGHFLTVPSKERDSDF